MLVPAQAQARRAAGRRGQGRRDAAHRLLPRRLDAGRPGGAGPAHPSALARAGAAQRRPQGGPGLAGPVHGAQRHGPPHRRGPRLARLLRAQHPDLRLAHPLGPRRLRQLPDLQHGGSRAQHRPGPLHHRRPARPAPGRPPALHLPGPADLQGDHPGRPRPGPRRGGLGRRRAARADPQPQRRGAPVQPRDRARVRPGQRGRGPRGRGPHDRPERGRAARGQARAPPRQPAAQAGADRRLVELRRPRHGHQVLVPVLQPGPPRLGDEGLRGRRARGGQGAAPPGGAQRLRQQQRGRHVGRARLHRAGRVGHRGPDRGAAHARRLAQRRTAAGQQLPVRHALDAGLLLRAPDRDRRGRRRARGRAALLHRLRGGARAAVRRHRRALRGQAQPGVGGPARAQAGRRRASPATCRRRCRCSPCGSAAGCSSPTRARAPRRSARGCGRRSGPRWRARACSRVVVSGLANEFILYFTTPEEHDRQHYEGGQTLFGRSSSTLVNEESATLAGRLVRGLPAQDAFPLDPTNGVRPDGPPYPSGAASGSRARAARGRGPAVRQGRVRLAGRPAGPRPARGQRVRHRPAAHPPARAPAGDLAQRSRRPRAWRCCGRSTPTAATGWCGRARTTPSAACTGSW